MPRFCAAFGCNSTYGRDKVAFHKFPEDEKMVAKWVNAVKRKNFKATKATVLCSKHFRDSDYVRSPALVRSLGLTMKSARLNRDAVPSVFSHKGRSSPPPRLAFAKRRKTEILAELLRVRNEEIEMPRPDNSPVAAVDDYPGDMCPPDNISVATAVHDSPGDALERGTHHPQTCDQCVQVVVRPTTGVKGVQVDMKKRKASCLSKTSQTKPQSVSIGIQVGGALMTHASTQVNMTVQEEKKDEECEEIAYDEDKKSDPDYTPLDDLDELHQECPIRPTGCGTRIFLVQEKCIHDLVSVCSDCLAPRTVTYKCEGTLVEVNGQCQSGHVFYWHNQEVEKQQPVLNLKLCGAVLFSGNNPTVSIRMLQLMGVQTISERTFFAVQRTHLWPAIGKVYQDEQGQLLKNCQKRPLKLAGDGRADSPGYSAKYGTYSLLDVETNKILHFEVVQSNEVGGSCRMELAGVQRALAFLESKQVEVGILITDRHTQVKSFMQKNKAKIIHEFDVWHMAKGITKKLQAAAKQNDCKELLPWIKAISNHMYWAAASSDGNNALIVPKWKSLLNHIQDIRDHEDEFPKCAHGNIEPREWLKAGSKALQKVRDLATAKPLLQDMPHLSTKYQTYGLEAFHNLLLHFTPKLYHYPYAGMKARTQLAVLHYNENSQREQACTKDGLPRWHVKYPKATGGEPVACPIMEPAKYGYVKKLLDAVIAAATPGKKTKVIPDTRSPLSSSFRNVDKSTEVAKRITRFNKQLQN